MNPPFLRSYWAVPGQLLAGCYPGDLDPTQRDAKLRGLLTAGVTLIVNLMEETETDHSGNPFEDYSDHLTEIARTESKSIRIARFAIHDQSVPTAAHMRVILQAIDEEISHGGIVYVHCWGGKGRTATVVGCHLLDHGRETPGSVLERLRELTSHASKFFWPTPQTTEQCEFINSWNVK